MAHGVVLGWRAPITTWVTWASDPIALSLRFRPWEREITFPAAEGLLRGLKVVVVVVGFLAP